VYEREDHDVVVHDLVRHCEWEAIEHGDAPVGTVFHCGAASGNWRIIANTASISSSSHGQKDA
jgi:hypothetical protein